MKRFLMRRSLLGFAICLGLLPALTSCGSAPQTAGSDASAALSQHASMDKPSEQLETVRVVLDWYPNAIHSFLYTARDQGFFKAEGIDLAIQFPANPNDALTMPAAGKADIGLYYPADVLVAKIKENVPIQVIGSVTQDPLSVMLSLKEKNIQTVDDLEGKTVGHASRPLDELVLQTMTKSTGEKIQQYTMQDVGFDLLTALTTGQVDVVAGCMVNHEVPVLKEKGFDVNIMYPTDHGVPAISEMVLVTGEDHLKNKKDLYTRFLKACQKGFEAVQKDPEKALDVLLENQEAEAFPLSRSVEKQSLDMLLPAMAKPGSPFLSQDKAAWQRTMEWLQAGGLIPKTIDPDELVVNLLP